MVITCLVRRLLLVLVAVVSLGGCGDDEPETGASAGVDSAAAFRDSAARADGSRTPLDSATTGDTSALASRDTTGGDSADAAKPAAPTRRYNVKSGVVELASSLGSQRQVIYFDDYGAKEAVHVITEGSSSTNTTVVVNAGGSSIVYDPEKKAGTRVDLSDALSQLGLGGIPNLGSLDDRMKRDLKYKPIAGRTVLGRKAEGASIEVVGTPLQIWTYQGIPLRMEAIMSGKPMVVEATSLKMDVAVPASRFVVPSDITLRDLKSNP